MASVFTLFVWEDYSESPRIEGVFTEKWRAKDRWQDIKKAACKTRDAGFGVSTYGMIQEVHLDVCARPAEDEVLE